jgi:hypothetical protein
MTPLVERTLGLVCLTTLLVEFFPTVHFQDLKGLFAREELRGRSQ